MPTTWKYYVISQHFAIVRDNGAPNQETWDGGRRERENIWINFHGKGKNIFKAKIIRSQESSNLILLHKKYYKVFKEHKKPFNTQKIRKISKFTYFKNKFDNNFVLILKIFKETYR